MSVVGDSAVSESGEFTGLELHEQPYGEFSNVNEETGILSGRRSTGNRNQSSWCGKLCSCCSSTSSRSAQNTAESMSSRWSLHSILNSCLIIAVMVGGYLMYLQQQNQLIQLEEDIALLRYDYERSVNSILKNISSLHEWEANYQGETRSEFKHFSKDIMNLSDTLDDQQHQLTRLSNGTSNADVLDKLKETSDRVNKHLAQEQEAFNKALTESNENVTRRLAENSHELIATKHHVEKSLNSTVDYMQGVVGLASARMNSLQQNMTKEINAMTVQVHTVVDKLGEQVKDAEDTIHKEVEAVQDNIAQYVAVTDKQFAAENDFVKYQLAGTFTLLACLISLWHITSHLRHYYKPDVQRRIMAVLWMVPIYSITSWLSLVWPNLESYLAALRDIYEAYAVYTFIGLLIAVLEDGRGLNGMINHLTQRVVEERDALSEYERLVAERAPTWSFLAYGTSWVSGSSSGGGNTDTTRLPPKPVEHIVPPFPCCYRVLRPVTVAAAWLYQCQLMAMQFVIMRPVLTIVPIILKDTGVCDVAAAPIYEDGAVNWLAPNLYVLFVTNVSVAIAFYGLLSFYHGTEKDLEWCDPWPKFLCIKGVVFCTFWQSLTIQFLSTAGRMDNHSAAQIQNLLICIEMFIASIAHFYIFPYEEWKDDYKREKEKGIMLKDTLALRDFVKDMSLMVTSWNTEVDMDMLSEERAKLNTELHSLRSGSRAGSTSRRNSQSRSQSLNGSPTSVSPVDSPYTRRENGNGMGQQQHGGSGDLERGIGYNRTLGLAAFSFDLVGSDLLDKGGGDDDNDQEGGRWFSKSRHSAGSVDGNGERVPLVKYQSQQLASRGMRRQDAPPIASASSGSSGGHSSYGAVPFSRNASTNTSAGIGRPSFDRTEHVRQALLQKIQSLSVDEHHHTHTPHVTVMEAQHHQQNVLGSLEFETTVAAGENEGVRGYGDEVSEGVRGVEEHTGETFIPQRDLSPPQTTTTTPLASQQQQQQLYEDDESKRQSGSFRQYHCDSLTFSPDSSSVNVYPSTLLTHTGSDLMGGRILFPAGDSSLPEEQGSEGHTQPQPRIQESLEQVLESHGVVVVEDDEGDEGDVSSIESDNGRKSQLKRKQRSRASSPLSSAGAIPGSGRFGSGSTGKGMDAINSAGEVNSSAGSMSSVFRDVHTPPPPTAAAAAAAVGVGGGYSIEGGGQGSVEISPLPDTGTGTWTAIPSKKSAAQQQQEDDGDDSDQSMYAV